MTGHERSSAHTRCNFAAVLSAHYQVVFVLSGLVFDGRHHERGSVTGKSGKVHHIEMSLREKEIILIHLFSGFTSLIYCSCKRMVAVVLIFDLDAG